MNLYKKNPEIDGSFCLNGNTLDDDSVVAGKEFDAFANPATFPGRPVKLVRVEFDDMTDAQKESAKAFVDNMKDKPPRHLGAITSKAFEMTQTGEPRIKISEPVRTAVAPTPKPEPIPEPEVEPKTVAEALGEGIEDPTKEAPDTSLDGLFTSETLAKRFPGVTPANAGKVLDKFDKVEDLAGASNVDLRSVGVRSNFFSKIRGEAKALLEEMTSEDGEE